MPSVIVSKTVTTGGLVVFGLLVVLVVVLTVTFLVDAGTVLVNVMTTPWFVGFCVVFAAVTVTVSV